MDYKIAQRLENMLDQHKFANPQTICMVLKEEIKPIIENYMTLSKDFVVRFKKDGNSSVFFVEFCAERIKPFGYIPQ